MATTPLAIVGDLCARMGFTVPSAVVGSVDPQVAQMRSLLEEECNDLSQRHRWQEQTIQGTWTTIANADQGALSAIFPQGFRAVVDNTIWDRTDRLPVLGPMAPEDYQALLAILATGPRYRYIIQGSHLLVNPAPAAGHAWAFEYYTKYFCTDSGGATYRYRFAADTDLVLLPEDLVLQGLRWRWKKEKGFDYAEDFRTYEGQVANAMGVNGSRKSPLYLDYVNRGPTPGIWVSPYNTVPT
jgi:hypothetical protein